MGSRKEYVDLANVLSKYQDNVRYEYLCSDIDVLNKHNDRFDKDRFMMACGVDVSDRFNE